MSRAARRQSTAVGVNVGSSRGFQRMLTDFEKLCSIEGHPLAGKGLAELRKRQLDTKNKIDFTGCNLTAEQVANLCTAVIKHMAVAKIILDELHVASVGSNSMSGKHVVDLGCGTGVTSLCALHLGAEKVTALDLNPDSLALLRRAAAANPALDMDRLETGLFDILDTTHDVPHADIVIMSDLLYDPMLLEGVVRRTVDIYHSGQGAILITDPGRSARFTFVEALQRCGIPCKVTDFKSLCVKHAVPGAGLHAGYEGYFLYLSTDASDLPSLRSHSSAPIVPHQGSVIT